MENTLRKRILILGGGFAVLTVVVELEKTLADDPSVEITLINRENFFLVHTHASRGSGQRPRSHDDCESSPQHASTCSLLCGRTALRGTTGPGIELLECLAPRDGRPFPSDEHSNDVVHRQTVLLTSSVDTAARGLSRAKVNFVSSSVVVNHNEQLDFTKAVIVRDPDGHAVEVEEK
jgi:hypothetical protein